MTTLGDLCELVGVQLDPQEYPAALYVGLEHVTPGRVIRSGGGTANEVQSSKFAFKKNDVLYGKLRPYLDKAVLADLDGICTTELLVLRAKADVDPRFLVAALHSSAFVGHALAGTTGVQHPRTSWHHIAEFEVPSLDPLSQARLANLTWSIHNAIIRCEQAQAGAAALKREATHELLRRGLSGEPRRETELGPVPLTWSVERLDSVTRVISTRMAYSELEALQPLVGPESVEVLGIKVSDMNLTGNETSIVAAALSVAMNKAVAQHKCAPPGAVVFPKRGAAIATNKKRMTASWSVFDPNVIGVVPGPRLDARFLFHWFQGFDLRSITEPGPTPQLNKKNLDPLPIAVPPDLDEQCEIADVLDTLDEKIDLSKRKMDALETLQKGVIDAALRGTLDIAALNLAGAGDVECLAVSS